ncbi:MAG: RNA-binding protein [Candidatus Thiodiazotropha sp.]|jgi:RNA recognition motif-containing protein
MKIIVRNLPRETTTEDLLPMFKAFGSVQSCNIVIDQATGKSKGFGFIEMPRVGEAKAAIKQLNNKELEGQKIRVKKAVVAEKSVEGKEVRE